VQIEALRQARRQGESNRRLVKEGLLASIDIVEADAQVANFSTLVARVDADDAGQSRSAIYYAQRGDHNRARQPA
jgi:outer membrane protein TolC